VRGARARTHEGSGIGLALVHELVRLHGGTVSVSSRLGQGTTFTVSIPARQRPPARRARRRRARAAVDVDSAGSAYVEEALRWLPTASAEARDGCGGGRREVRRTASRPRASCCRRQRRHARLRPANPRAALRVDAVPDGQAALAAAERNPPDLIVTDVMMAGRLDGFELVRRLRQHEALAAVPISCCRRAPATRRASTAGRGRGRLPGQAVLGARADRAHRDAAQDGAAAAIRREARRHGRGGDARQGRIPRHARHELRNPAGADPDDLAGHAVACSNVFEKERALIEPRQVRHCRASVDDLLEVTRIARANFARPFVRRPGGGIRHATSWREPAAEQRMHHLTIDSTPG
jgi:signal transduction histidine kinase